MNLTFRLAEPLSNNLNTLVTTLWPDAVLSKPTGIPFDPASDIVLHWNLSPRNQPAGSYEILCLTVGATYAELSEDAQISLTGYRLSLIYEKAETAAGAGPKTTLRQPLHLQSLRKSHLMSRDLGRLHVRIYPRQNRAA